MNSARHTVIVIPTYNEADNITDLLARLREASPTAHVLFVDDQSPDGTADRIREASRGDARIFLLAGGERRGLGAAYRAGFGWALDSGYDAVVQMDADLSHPPELVPALIGALDEADISVGSRYVTGGSVENWGWSRRLLSRLANAYVRHVLGVPVRDTTAGFKAFTARALRDIDVLASTSTGYCFQIENTWMAHRAGLVITEVPFMFTDRARGTSKMSSDIALEALTRVLAWRWAEITHARSRPDRRPGRPAGSSTRPPPAVA